MGIAHPPLQLFHVVSSCWHMLFCLDHPILFSLRKSNDARASTFSLLLVWLAPLVLLHSWHGIALVPFILLPQLIFQTFQFGFQRILCHDELKHRYQVGIYLVTFILR